MCSDLAESCRTAGGTAHSEKEPLAPHAALGQSAKVNEPGAVVASRRSLRFNALAYRRWINLHTPLRPVWAGRGRGRGRCGCLPVATLLASMLSHKLRQGIFILICCTSSCRCRCWQRHKFITKVTVAVAVTVHRISDSYEVTDCDSDSEGDSDCDSDSDSDILQSVCYSVSQSGHKSRAKVDKKQSAASKVSTATRRDVNEPQARLWDTL